MKKSTLTRSEREQRIERRAGVREAAAAKVEALREWRRQRAEAVQARIAEERKAGAKQPRGVDRVPAHLRGLAVQPEWLHQHAGHPYTPYVNPARRTRLAKSGRLRKDLP